MAEQADALGSNPGSSKECEFDSHQGDHQAAGQLGLVACLFGQEDGDRGITYVVAP